jgi:hypothetical protein
MANDNTKRSRIFPTALMALAMTLVISTGAAAGPDQIASRDAPIFKTSSKNFDFCALETKIRNTNAIDFFSKINLKNEIDSLIDDFRNFQVGESAYSFGALKARFENLIRNTVAMLRKGDAALAEEIERSGEALWTTLNTPEKLVAIASFNHNNQHD